MKYQLAIFDFDGTLANSLPRMLKIFNRLAEEYRFRKIADEDIETLRTLEIRQMLKKLGIPFWKLPGIARRLRQLISSETDQIALFPGVDEFLKHLMERGIRLAIVSSNSWENIQQILGPQNSALFDFTECSASIFGKRPKLRKVLRKSGITHAHSIYIGDEVRDLHAAKAEKLPFGAVTWGYTPVNIFTPHQPQEIFDSVADMSDKLTRPLAIETADSLMPRTEES